MKVIRAEITQGCTGLLGRQIPLIEKVDRDGAIVIGTPETSSLIAGLRWDLQAQGHEGYIIRSVKAGGRSITVIASNGEQGLLHGAFHFLRLLQTQSAIEKLNIAQKTAHGTATAQPLGQSGRQHRTRLRRRVALEMV